MDELKRLRKILGWSQNELARKLGVSRQYIYHLEMGTSPIRKKHVTALNHLLETEILNQQRMWDPAYADIRRLIADISENAERRRKQRSTTFKTYI